MAVLRRLQQFDPPGVFARDIRECLIIQLQQLSLDTPYRNQAIRLASEFLQDIASIDLTHLAKKTRYSQEDLQGGLRLIRSLNPRPGEALTVNQAEYIVPDAYVEKRSGRWPVRLTDGNAPRLNINDLYSNLLKRSDDSKKNQFPKDNLTEDNWIARRQESRNELITRESI